MKIAIVTEFCTPYFNGGGEIRYHEIAKRLVKQGHRVDLICCRFKNSPKYEIIDGINIYHIGPVIKNPPKRTIRNFIHYIISCFAFLIKNKYDVIDSNTYIPLIPSFLASKLKRTPIIATINILIGDWKADIYNPKVASLIEKILFKLPYNKILTVSNYAKNELVNKFNISESKINVVYNGVDMDFIESIKAKPNKNTLIFVGRITWFKHIEDLLEATARLKKDIQDINLKIITNGTKTKILEKQIEDFNIKENVEVIDKLPYREVIKTIKESSLLVLPSTKDTFGIVLAEAGAAGKPVVAYNAGGAMDVVIDGENGFLAEPRNINDLTNKIKKIISNENLSKEMGIKGKKLVEKKFTWDKTADTIENLYKTTLKIP